LSLLLSLEDFSFNLTPVLSKAIIILKLKKYRYF
jgi:hypothetical protein